MGLHKIVNAAEPTDLQDVVTKNYVDSKAVVSRSGDAMTEELNMNNNKITHPLSKQINLKQRVR